MLLCSVYISPPVFALRLNRVTTAALTAPSLSVDYEARMLRPPESALVKFVDVCTLLR